MGNKASRKTPVSFRYSLAMTIVNYVGKTQARKQYQLPEAWEDYSERELEEILSDVSDEYSRRFKRRSYSDADVEPVWVGDDERWEDRLLIASILDA